MNAEKFDQWLERGLLVIAPIAFALSSLFLWLAHGEIALAIGAASMAAIIRVYAHWTKGHGGDCRSAH